MVGCDAPYWTSFSGLTWCLFSFTQWHLLILPKTQAFPQLSIGTAHGSWRSLWWFCCRILWLFFCINDQPCRISPKKKKSKFGSISTNQQWCLGSAGTGKKTIAGEVSPDPKHHTLIPPMASAMIASLGFKMWRQGPYSPNQRHKKSVDLIMIFQCW